MFTISSHNSALTWCVPQTWPWVELTHGLCWVGLGRVRSNMIYYQAALVNISCYHEYFLIPITLIFRIIQCTSVTTNEHEPTNHSRALGREELAGYKAMRVTAKHSSPLEFWKENSPEFPLLAEVARRILCISATSAQSERDFSAVSRTITE